MKYSEKTIRKKAHSIGYSIHKGFVHFMNKEYPVWHHREVGYNVVDQTNNSLVWGCYNDMFDHLWSLEDVEQFLINIYKEYDLKY